MTKVPKSATKNVGTYRFFVSLLLKLVGLVLLFFSIGYWTRLVGIADPAVGFDTLPTYWKIAGPTLVVLMPIAALGLWGNAKWGIVVWLMVVAIELVMYGFYPGLFGEAQSVIVFHLVSVMVYLLGMALILYIEQRNLHRSEI